MRVALLIEGVRMSPERGTGTWFDRLAEGLREHDFESYVLAGSGVGAGARGRWLGVHELALRGRRPGGRLPGALRRRQYGRAYEELVRALVMPGERTAFGAGLYRLAALSREDGALPAFLASAHARRTLERAWRSPGADTSAGQPLVCDVLVAADLLEQCLRPLSAPWYGAGPGGLGGADLCHVVGGGPAALPALVAKQMHGVPFVVTEHGLHLREQYLGYRAAPYRWPVRALMLSFFRALTEETYRQAAILTPGSAHDQQWQRRCGADPARTRVVHEGTPAVARAAAGPEPAEPTLVWAGALEPGRDTELMLHAFARVRAELPAARLVVHGEEAVRGYRAHCEAVAERLGVAGAVEFAGRPESTARAWEGATVVVFSALSQHSPRLLADAMLSGRAVVSTDVGVVREVVGPTGLLVPPRDPQALAGACLALLQDEERRARLGLAGRLRAQERFAVEPVIAAFREIYLELVSQWPAFPAAAGGGAGARPRPFARPAEYWLADRRGEGLEGTEGTEAGGDAPEAAADRPGALAEAV
ncbi:glycosyltransferase [Kitasatospora sp. NBC_00039]|uniref:glycosyltransferase n=1 Tax=Kitasatospora sp. NBC_00039 TaxID=2903565 RepID=UPI003253E187